MPLPDAQPSVESHIYKLFVFILKNDIEKNIKDVFCSVSAMVPQNSDNIFNPLIRCITLNIIIVACSTAGTK